MKRAKRKPKKKPVRKKSPIVAGVLNFIIWGLGYIYLGKKTVFAVLLIIADLLINVATIPVIWRYVTDPQLSILTLALLIVTAALIYDGYQEGVEYNKR